ncbi:hypothetical protein SteCoe_22902 [Stentor coeruleus]|uniref:Uncharacterized protein n=1 Tax=Stentor coeruleus TaxID=5963 RepID=A0A1R2BLT0_9CILI|nr:hypothetical protein SteCoe_22902 [Stentor coeruleus]
MQLNGAFWAAIRGFQMNSHSLEALLSQDETTTQSLLNDENVIQETRNQNPKLMNFLNAERMEYLIEVITVFPSNDADTKRAHNHPFIACEMLSEPSPLHETIFNTPFLFDKLFCILKEKHLHSTLSGYFSKAVQALISKNSDKSIELFKEKNVFEFLSQHLYSKSIVDIVLKILTFENSQTSLYLEERKGLLAMVIENMKNPNSQSVYFAGYILNEILQRATDLNSWQDLVLEILTVNNVEEYFKFIISGSSEQSVAAANIIKGYFVLNCKFSLKSLLLENPVYKCFNKNIGDINNKLAMPNENKILGTSGEVHEVLGETKLKIIELISFALKDKSDDYSEIIINSQILTTITSTFFAMPWNSFLHNSVEGIVILCVSSKNQKLIDSMLYYSGFLNEMIKYALMPDPKHRLGFLGYINKIANYLKNSICEDIKSNLDKTDKWEEFSKNYLEIRNNFDNKQLGELKKCESSSSESDSHENDNLKSINQPIPNLPPHTIIPLPIYSTQNEKVEKNETLAEIVGKKIEEVVGHEAVFADEKKDQEEEKVYEEVKKIDEEEKVYEEVKKVEEEKFYEEMKKIEEDEEKVHEEEKKFEEERRMIHEELKKMEDEEKRLSEEFKVHDFDKEEMKQEEKKTIVIENEHQSKEAGRKGSPIGQYIRTFSPS